MIITSALGSFMVFLKTTSFNYIQFDWGNNHFFLKANNKGQKQEENKSPFVAFVAGFTATCGNN